MRWLFASSLVLLAACSDDPKPAPAPADAAATPAPEPDAGPVHETVDAGPPSKPELRCTPSELAAHTMTDGGLVEISFPTGGDPAQYTNHCVTVKKGAAVLFRGSFRQHPLEPAGGDEPTPIAATDHDVDGGALAVTFPNVGTFGFECMFHPSLMFGAIKVVP